MDGKFESLNEWKMYDVSVTFSILAPTSEVAYRYVEDMASKAEKQLLQADHLKGSPAYNRDHCFVDCAKARVCDCNGH